MVPRWKDQECTGIDGSLPCDTKESGAIVINSHAIAADTHLA
jgi:hypothetical protein